VDDPALYPSLADASGLALAGYTYFPPAVTNPYMTFGTYAPRNYGAWTPYGGGPGFGYGYGYGYPGMYGFPGGGYGYGRVLGGNPLRSFPGLPGRTVLPTLPVRSPGVVTGYHPPTFPSFPTSRPGAVAAPAIPRPTAPASPGAVHGGRR
jgi:hypothetical protein